jgi:alpha-1,6-rhamnosyltransferase
MPGGSHDEGSAPPLVSAVMPVFDGEAFLEPAIESVLAQDYERFELVVCDDGSTDRTPQILDRYPKVTVVRQANRGTAAARNAAIAVAGVDLVAFFDADDLWPPHRLSSQAEYLRSHPEVACVLGRQEWINPPVWLRRDTAYGDLDGVPMMSAMIRRTVLDELGGFDPSYRTGEDTDLLIRLRGRGLRLEVLDEIVLFRRHHERRLTGTDLRRDGLMAAVRAKLERERGPAPS